MSQMYIVMCATWGGSTYSYAPVEAFYSECKASNACSEYQGLHDKANVEYYVELVDVGDSDD